MATAADDGAGAGPAAAANDRDGSASGPRTGSNRLFERRRQTQGSRYRALETGKARL